MGFVKDIFSDKGGANFQATTASPEQLGQSYGNTQMGLQQQQDFINQLHAQAMGGMDPVQQQFQNNVNQLAQQQAGAISSQKGISPALAARMINQQGGAAMQNAAGQGAQLAGQQQLNNQQAYQNALNSYSQTALGQQGNLLGIAGSANSANAGLAQQKLQTQGQIIGGVVNAAGGAISPSAGAAGKWQGGEIDGPSSGFGKHMHSFQSGGAVNGGAPVAGDSPKNDIVPAMLSPKEIVLPRSITLSDDAPKKAAEFVAAIKARNGFRK